MYSKILAAKVAEQYRLQHWIWYWDGRPWFDSHIGHYISSLNLNKITQT